MGGGPPSHLPPSVLYMQGFEAGGLGSHGGGAGPSSKAHAWQLILLLLRLVHGRRYLECRMNAHGETLFLKSLDPPGFSLACLALGPDSGRKISVRWHGAGANPGVFIP